jgi:hypothetical protein
VHSYIKLRSAEITTLNPGWPVSVEQHRDRSRVHELDEGGAERGGGGELRPPRVGRCQQEPNLERSRLQKWTPLCSLPDKYEGIFFVANYAASWSPRDGLRRPDVAFCFKS